MTNLAVARAKANGCPHGNGHAITIQDERKHGEIRYRAVCSCGRYRSTPRGYTGHAEQAGRDHFEAKHGG